jgi:hypothetical protein
VFGMTQNRTTQLRVPWIGAIWGQSRLTKTMSSGLFRCPTEQTERAYWSHRVRNWHTLFSVPVVPGRVAEEYIECFCCGSTWDPRVVSSDHPALRAG